MTHRTASSRRLSGAAFLVFLAPLLFTACIRNPATHRVQTRLLSPQAERRIGQEAKNQILQEYKVFASTPVTSYVTRVGLRVAAVSDRPTVDYDFTVLDSDLINAFAVPGGFVFVTRGLLDQVDDEAELAMVLGHEIGHVAAMHGVQMIQKEMGQNALTILGTIGAAIALGPEAMIMVAKTSELFSNLYLLGYSREKELEADNLGLQYMMRAGYDPQAALRFLRQLQKMDPDKAQGWDLYFRTHPNTSDRIAIIESMIGSGPTDTTRAHEAEYQQIKKLLPRVNAGERGVIRGHTYINTVHELELTVPDNWTLDFIQPQSLVSMQSADNEGEGRLQVVDLSSVTRTAEDLAYQYAKSAGFELASGRQVLYQAGYGYLGKYYGVSPSGKLLDLRLFATIRRKKGYILMCGANPDKADSYALDLERILRSFRFERG